MSGTRGFQARLECEALEKREMLAANLIFNNYTGQLTIDGTSHADTARVSMSGSNVKADLTYGGTTISKSYSAGSVRNVVFHGFEGNDKFYNDASKPSVVYGGAGDDYVKGGNAYDKVYGGSGNDTIIGNGAGDVLVGLAGNDKLYGGYGDDKIYGGSGTDYIDAGTGSNAASQNSSGVGSWVYVTEEWVRSKSLTAMEREVINYTNMEREKVGLPPLKLNIQLTQAAQYHATNMAVQQKMAHVLDGVAYGDLASRLDWVGYDYYTAGENVAVNFEDAQAVVKGWMSSTGHRANILDSEFEEIGVGIRFSSAGSPYFCQEFGKQW